MYRLTAAYLHPENPEAFLKHYREVHAVLAAKMPKLRSYEWGVCESPDGSRPSFFLVAFLDWDTKEDALEALQSPEGQAGAADLPNFTSADQVHMAFSEITKAV
ncbi:EthD family reductase [Prauserella flavalba]|uniref:Ethyl tert-butyl ether degradation protein n=1 Tax=Prauserella flavalba TaxID=1477506 RepID=A0A318M7Y1_9PSEU|nr:EthD family reductase [Prauserella flavalba]PXY33724.1 ethyl tert-butyl ether degradation protein [Prauserella flavalba]